MAQNIIHISFFILLIKCDLIENENLFLTFKTKPSDKPVVYLYARLKIYRCRINDYLSLCFYSCLT
ncbi:hypothetical protein D3C87_14360 [compost metagenome]